MIRPDRSTEYVRGASEGPPQAQQGKCREFFRQRQPVQSLKKWCTALEETPFIPTSIEERSLSNREGPLRFSGCFSLCFPPVFRLQMPVLAT